MTGQKMTPLQSSGLQKTLNLFFSVNIGAPPHTYGCKRTSIATKLTNKFRILKKFTYFCTKILRKR